MIEIIIPIHDGCVPSMLHAGRTTIIITYYLPDDGDDTLLRWICVQKEKAIMAKFDGREKKIVQLIRKNVKIKKKKRIKEPRVG